VVSMLAIGTKVHGLKPGRGRWIFNGDKEQQGSFLRRGIKLSGPFCKILRHVN
jgi:hypothetical protein